METGNTQIVTWLDRLKAGDDRARDELVRHACERLHALAGTMLAHYPRLRRWEQTDDVLQSAMLRLHRSLATVQPESPQHFFRLATTQIRRELIDLARRHFGPLGQATFQETNAEGGPLPSADQKGPQKSDRAAVDDEPTTLLEWSEFHERVKSLPEDELEVFNLLWYGGLTQTDAAALLGASLRTVNRRWTSARLRLAKLLRGEMPDEN